MQAQRSEVTQGPSYKMQGGLGEHPRSIGAGGLQDHLVQCIHLADLENEVQRSNVTASSWASF